MSALHPEVQRNLGELLAPIRRPAEPLALGPVGCILSYHDLDIAGWRERSHRAMRRAREWANTHRPESYTLNMRFGPSTWLAAEAIRQGIPVHAVVARGQLENQPWDVRDHVLWLWHSAASQRVASTWQERDALIVGEVHCLTLDEILSP